MKNSFLTNWNFMRIFRLLIGVAILVQAFVSKDVMFGLVGLFFTVLPMLNIGCCGVNGCATPTNKVIKNKEISYEEVV